MTFFQITINVRSYTMYFAMDYFRKSRCIIKGSNVNVVGVRVDVVTIINALAFGSVTPMLATLFTQGIV